MEVTIQLQASQTLDHHTVDLEELELSGEEWTMLTDKEQAGVLQKYVDDLPEHPYWVVDLFTTTP